jgi:hypothetical protein
MREFRGLLLLKGSTRANGWEPTYKFIVRRESRRRYMQIDIYTGDA